MPRHLLLLFAIAAILFACNSKEEKKQTFVEFDSIQKHNMDSLLMEYNKEHPHAILRLHKEGKYYTTKSVTYYTFGRDPIIIEQWYYTRQCKETGFLYIHSGEKKGIIQLPWNSMTDSTRVLTNFTDDFAIIQSKFIPWTHQIMQFVDEFLADHLHLTRVKIIDMLPLYKDRYNATIGCEEPCLKNLDSTFKRAEYYINNRVLKTRVYTDGVKFIVATVNPKFRPLVKFEVLNPECNCKICD